MSNIISVTDKALCQLRILLKNQSEPCVGIRIGVKSGGCSGFKYYLEYADSIAPYDEIVECNEIVLLIDGKALMYLLGTEMDYQDTQFRSGFTFSNPNEKTKCGCGKSFGV
jgi:iron-sulfur cluster assembly protein